MSTAIGDFASSTLTVVASAPQVATGNVTQATGSDMITGDHQCWMEVAIGTFAGTSCSVQVSQSDAPGSGFVDITGAVLAGTGNNSVQKVSFRRDKRYVRAVATIVATSCPISVVFGELLKQL